MGELAEAEQRPRVCRCNGTGGSAVGDPVAALWPVPRLPRVVLASRWAIAVVVVALAVAFDGMDGVERPERPLPARWRRLQSGGEECLTVTILGGPPWAPPTFDRGRPVVLSATGASTSVGIESTRRWIPLRDLTAVRVRRPEGQTEAREVGRRAWVLDLVDTRGVRSALAGDLADLALVAAVAGWEAPPGLPSTPAGRWRQAPGARKRAGGATHA